MSTEEQMTIDERYKYLRMMQKRYRKAGRPERSQLLGEMQIVTQFHRKSLVRLMKGELTRKPRRRQRGRKYGPEVDDALRVIAESLDYICAERLQPTLVWMSQHLAEHDELEVDDALIAQLSRISVSTVGRILRRIRQDQPHLPRRKRPRQVRGVLADIPTKRIPWDEQQPGHFEVDTVHHCGISSAGNFIHSLQMLDVATGWSERVAVLGRSYLVMRDGFARILARLPFPVREMHPDNGSEFLNELLISFWEEALKGVAISRSRPYQKNDNRFVEQGNGSLVRAYLGYQRLDTVAQTNLLNQVYDKMWLYYNFFQPVMRLSEKTVLPANGSRPRVKRRYDQPQTPFERVCARSGFPPEKQQALETLRAATNPRKLREEIYTLLDQLLNLPNARPGKTEDVYQTLFQLPAELLSIETSNKAE